MKSRLFALLHSVWDLNSRASLVFYHVGSSVALYERVQWGDKEVVILHLGYELRHDMRGKCGIIALSSLRTAVRAEDVSIFLLTFRAHFVHFDASRFIEG